MKTKISTLIAVFYFATFMLPAQQGYLGQIAFDNVDIKKKSESTSVSMDIDLSNLTINKNHLLTITPFVKSIDGAEAVQLPPVCIVGGRRNVMLTRPFTWKGKIQPDPDAVATVVRKNGTEQKIHYATTLDFNEWQRNAYMALQEDVTGCADCQEYLGEQRIKDKILPDLFIPDFRMNYIIPEVEQVKERSEKFSAHLNYEVGRHNLLPNFKNNAEELAMVDKSVNMLKSDKDLTISDLVISGYASPEGGFESNMQLSKRRAETFATYLEKKYDFKRDQFKVEWFGEDWKGLREAVVASSLEKRQEILDIIDSTTKEDDRDALLIALDNGQTYKMLLDQFYPPLRRNDYDVKFISRAFNIDETKQVLKSYPKKLSLNEMFLVAKTYPEESTDFKTVIDIAADTFPDSDVANLNAAVSELRANNPDAALKRLQRVAEKEKAANLMGIAYAQKEEYEKALTFLQNAADTGNADAIHNLEQLEMLFDDIR